MSDRMTVTFVRVEFKPGGFTPTTDTFGSFFTVTPAIGNSGGFVCDHFVARVSPSGKAFKFWHNGKESGWRRVRDWKFYRIEKVTP